MQTAETDNLNKNIVDYSQHTVVLIELAVLEHQCVFESSWAQIQTVKPEQHNAKLLTEPVSESSALDM